MPAPAPAPTPALSCAHAQPPTTTQTGLLSVITQQHTPAPAHGSRLVTLIDPLPPSPLSRSPL
ncbi:hypothetical protein FRC10_005245, partial [Ceratobasidium sp. 414]